MKKTATLIPFLASLVAAPAIGAISLITSDILNVVDGPTSGTFSFAQAASTEATFMVALYGRRLASASPTITYDTGVGGSNTSVNPSAFINFDVTGNGSGTDDVFAAIFVLDVGSVSAGSVDIGWDSGSTNTTMDVFQLSGAMGAGIFTDTATAIGTSTANSAVLDFDLGSAVNGDSFALIVGASSNNALQSGGHPLTGGTSPVKADADQGAYSVSSAYDLGDVTQTYSLAMRSNAAGAIVALSVPEPSTYAIFAGLAALGFVFWRRRRMR